MEKLQSDVLQYDATPVLNTRCDNDIAELERETFNESERDVVRTNSGSNVNNNTTLYQFSHINGLHIGPTVILKNSVNDEKNSVRKKTRSIEMMMQSTEPLNKTMIDTISTHLGKSYKSVIRNLGFSDGQIEQAIMDFYINGSKEVIYQLLLEWTRKNYDVATLGKITQILWKSNHKECVYKMKETYKAEILKK